jgi:DNA polymerase-3 subunit gamma/tau
VQSLSFAAKLKFCTPVFMSYQVLARKWRPQVFDDVLGQEHITSILKNMLETGRIHHGYLFSGIRGIGKTTTARILAKALNCVHGPTPTPCNQCEFCKEITEGYSMDVEEIDGASNRGVDEVHILQDDASYAPSRSRHKVFIIDEVHSLTTPAFNALLKTLEEPPSNVVFIMATTEPWKVPLTILSRCQQFKFRESSSSELVGLLKKLAQHEQITISDDSLALIAKTAGGSVRDAENLFDQVIGFSGNIIRDEDVRYVLGIPDHQILRAFLTAMFDHQTAQMFSLMEQLVSQGYNLRFFCMELMERIRNLIVLKIAKHPEPYLVLFDYSRAELERYALRTTLSVLQQLYWLIAEAERNIKFSPTPRFVLEMALAKMANIQALEPIEELNKQLQDIKAVIEATYPREFQQQPRSVSQQKTVPQSSDRQPSQRVLEMWETVLDLVKQKSRGLGALLRNAIPVELTQDTFTLGFHQDTNLSKTLLEDPKKMTILSEALQEYLGRTVKIVTTIHNGAVSIATMREKLDQQIASKPTPKIAPQQSMSRGSTEPRSQKSKGNWKKRSNKQPLQYKPQVQVTVQDIVKIFEGEVEE